MFESYLKIAAKSLLSHRVSTFINISGLCLGIACSLVIAYLVKYDLSFDSFHTHADRIYRVVRVSEIEGSEEYRTGTSLPLYPAMKSEIASLKGITTVNYWGGAQIDILNKDGNSVNKFLENDGGAFVDSSFFKVFDFHGTRFHWIEGNPETALSQPNSVVLSASIAKKYFGDDEALGRVLKIANRLGVTVTGVVNDLPQNTDFPFKIFISYSTLTSLIHSGRMTDWGSVDDDNQIYIILPPHVSKIEMEKQIAKLHSSHAPEIAKFRHYLLQPLHEVKMDSRFGNFTGRTISEKTLWALGLSGLFLLLLVCINFINLSIARSMARSREVGIRKVIGGSRSQIIAQFMAETFIITLIAGILAILLDEAIKPELQVLFNFNVTGLFLLNIFVLKTLGVIILTVTLVAGIYPALMQSGFPPVTMLKNTLTTKVSSGLQFSNVLILVQFTITLILVTGTLIIYRQMKFFNQVDLGFNKDAVVNVHIPEQQASLLSTFRNELLSNALISKISFSSTLPSGNDRSHQATDIRRKDAADNDNQVFECQFVDPEYINLYQMKLVAGRNFTSADTSGSIILNQTLVKKLNYKDPEEAIGSLVKMGEEVLTVVGVVKDFHTGSLKDGMEKVGLVYNPRAFNIASIKLSASENRLNAGQIHQTIDFIKKNWAVAFPDKIFDYSFLDKNIEAFYKQDLRFSEISQILSVLFLLIGCLGLYGLISFIINKKMKEIAIRKILGASLPNVLLLLTRNYLKLVLFAFIVAVPFSYYLMNNWLQKYAFRIGMQWWFFFIPLILILFTSILTVGGHTLKAARRNPADIIKYE